MGLISYLASKASFNDDSRYQQMINLQQMLKQMLTGL